jgi:ATP-binding cassette subfamily B protein
MSEGASTRDRRLHLLRDVAGVWRLCWRAGPWLTVAQLASTVVMGLLPAAVAWQTKLVIDELAAGDHAAALGPAGGLAATGLVTAALPHLTGYLQGEHRRRMDRLTQDRLYTAVGSFQGLSRFENPRFLDRLRMATQATGAAAGPITTGLFGVGRSVITLVTLLVTLYLLTPVMTGVVLVAAVPTLAAQMSLARRRVTLLAGVTPAMRRQVFYAQLITEVQAAKEIRILGLGDFLKGRLLTELAGVQAGERRLDRRVLWTQSALALLGAAVTGLGLLWAVRKVSTGELSLGDVSAFVAALAGAQTALVSLVDGIAGGHEALLMFSYYAEVTSLPDDLAPAAAPGPRGVPDGTRTALPALRRGIELRDVWFRYDESHPWVLRGVDLTIPSGATVALVGLNGSGKSTLVKLLCRFYDPERGGIHWDGVDIRHIDPAQLRRRIGVLFQDFMSYDLTAAENVGVGDLDAFGDRSRIERAAELAGIHDAVAALPKGYDTPLTRAFIMADDDAPVTGVVLSGGQWQRLALARTLMRDGRDLLVLDEPSAGLDARAEHEIHHRLRDHRAGRTSLLISHRLGTVRDADLIVVLDGGQIVEQGSHEQLLATGGRYAQLFRMQATGYHAVEVA